MAIAELGVPLDLLASLVDQFATLLPTLPAPDAALRSLSQYLGAVRSPIAEAALFQRDPVSLAILMKILAASPYLAWIVIGDPEAWEEVRLGEGRPVKRASVSSEIAAEVAMVTDVDAVMAALRRFKRREMLRIAYGDIVVGQRLEVVVSQISHLADAVLSAALDVAWRRVAVQRGEPRDALGQPVRLAVIALGKLGGVELNYSSDIDLVFVSSGDGRTTGPRPSTNAEFFERVVQELVRLLAEPTGLGIAYRVDLRLRPMGASGPVVVPIDAMLQYFDTQGRTWERQAWIKARVAAGDEQLGARLLADLEPWIYRRWLTRADISGIKALKRRIEQRAIREGHDQRDVKVGRGGIRDVETTIQFLQLLSGGDTPQVRTGNTLEAIRRLAETGALTDKEREVLERTYTFLRTVEHRLQILFDTQTHTLPDSTVALEELAVRLGHAPGATGLAAFQRELEEATRLNRTILDHLLHDAFPGDEDPEPETDLVLDPDPAESRVQELLGRHGFRDTAAAARHLASLGEEKVRFLSTRRCRHFLAAIAPRLLAAIGATPDPDATLVNLARVSESLGGKGVLWELFSSHPRSLDLYVRLCASSPYLSGLLIGNPGMIDELLDSLLVGRLPTPAELDALLAEWCRGAVDPEPILHAFKASQQLRVGVGDILGKQDVTATTRTLTGVAEAILKWLVADEEAKLVERLGEPTWHDAEGDTAGGRAAAVVLAMGKFGGHEMNYHSDVDLIFLYDHDGSTSPARRTRRATETTTNAHFFGTLAQRVMKSASAFGPHGRLYEVDSRLRPSGKSGPAAISLDAFAQYFAEDGPAADWERQALTKARVVVGSVAAKERLQKIIEQAAYGYSWGPAEIEGIRQMRLRMQQGAATSNLKRGPGGVADIEFVVQMLQLVHGGANRSLRTTETLAGLVDLHAADVLTDDSFEFFETAYRVLRSIEGRLRLLNATARHEFPKSPEERQKLAHLLGYERPELLEEDVRQLTVRTREEFEAIFAERGRSE
jgi:glutamate-ammonia-ligase adenylyltransferase